MMESLFDVEPVIEASKSNEWYTPSRYIDAAREVMGGIDLDPASCEQANEVIKATKFYSIGDDGLSHKWTGCVWLNPPFSKDMTQPNEKRSGIYKWVRACIDGYQAGEIKQAIILATTRASTPWFNDLWEYPICFCDHNVQFFVPYAVSTWSGKMSHIHGTCFAYLGPNEQKFIDIFSRFGTIAKRISTPKAKPATLPLWEGGAA